MVLPHHSCICAQPHFFSLPGTCSFGSSVVSVPGTVIWWLVTQPISGRKKGHGSEREMDLCTFYPPAKHSLLAWSRIPSSFPSSASPTGIPCTHSSLSSIQLQATQLTFYYVLFCFFLKFTIKRKSSLWIFH